MTARVIDVETTGTKETDRCVEISIIDLGGEGVFTTLLDPEIMIPPEATDSHGITMTDVVGQPKFRDVAHEIRGLIESAEAMIGYCHDFDQGMVDAEFKRIGSEPLRWPVLVDAKRLWDVYEPREKRSLTNAFKRFVNTEGFQGAHRSLNDCRATAAVLRAQLREFGLEGKPWITLDPDRAAWWGPTFHVLLKDGALLMNFGKNRGRRAADVDHGFWQWLIPRDFPEHVVRLAMEVCHLIEGRYSTDAINERLVAWAVAHAVKCGWNP